MMKKLLLALAMILGFSANAYGQGASFSDTIFGPNVQVRPGAQITVCTHPSSVATCAANKILLYTDINLVTTVTNPVTADGNGKFLVYGPPGTYDYIVTGTGISAPTSVSTFTMGGGSSSGGCTPAFPAGALQKNSNASPGICASSSITEDSSGNDIAAQNFDVTKSSCFGGPRPWIDITCPPYNAKGDSSTDDTAAISAAITAACNTTTALNGFAMHPAVVFPPGIYRVQQPQTPSTAPIFAIPCGYLEILGLPGGAGEQYGQPGAWIDVLPGASPNAAPVWLVSSATSTSVHNIKFKDIETQGYNEALAVTSVNFVVLDNAPMIVNGTTGLTDNTAIKLTNVFWFWRVNHSDALTQGSSTTPTVLYTTATPINGEQPLDGLIYTLDDIDGGGAEQYIQRVAPGGSGSGNFVFRDLLIESNSSGILNITNTSGFNMGAIGPFEFDQIGSADGGVAPCITLNDSTGSLSGVKINHMGGCTPTIQLTAGHILGYQITGCYVLCNYSAVVDANGNAIGTGSTGEQFGGWDHVTDQSYETAYPTAGLWYGGPTLSDRWCPSGGDYCSLGMDSGFGVLFGLGDTNAFNAGLKQTAAETLDIQFAQLLPPTGFSGTATTGGSLAAATYYAAVWSSTVSTCSSVNSSYTVAAGVAVSGANNAVNFTWTVPITTPSAPAGYCVYVGTSPLAISNNAPTYIFVTGASTTSFLYTGQSQTASSARDANSMVSLFRWNQTGILPLVLFSAAGTPLPTCASGLKGQAATVSDAASPTYMGAYTSGGGITTAVICSYNGSTYSWLTH